MEGKRARSVGLTVVVWFAMVFLAIVGICTSAESVAHGVWALATSGELIPLEVGVLVIFGAAGMLILASVVLAIVIERLFRYERPTLLHRKLLKLVERSLPVFFLLFLGFAAIEELLFRVIGLGLLPTLFPGALRALFWVQAIVFALIHLGNFKKNRRNPLMVLPQLLGGLLFGYIFLAAGLFAATLVHAVSNMLVLLLFRAGALSGRISLAEEDIPDEVREHDLCESACRHLPNIPPWEIGYDAPDLLEPPDWQGA